MTQITPTANAEMKAMVHMEAHGIPAHFVEDDGTVIVNVPSSTRPDIDYTAAHGPERTFCTCEAHINHRDCWHVAVARLIYVQGTPWIRRRIEDYSSITLTLQ